MITAVDKVLLRFWLAYASVFKHNIVSAQWLYLGNPG